MNCKHITRRSKKYEIYWYCRLYKKKIELHRCYKCSCFETKKLKEIKKKSNKLANMEKKRFSIFTNDLAKCYYCGKRLKKIDKHEVFGGSNRQRSMKNGFVVGLCNECHSDEVVINELRKDLQKEYEKSHSREDFIRLIGKSYL